MKLHFNVTEITVSLKKKVKLEKIKKVAKTKKNEIRGKRRTECKTTSEEGIKNPKQKKKNKKEHPKQKKRTQNKKKKTRKRTQNKKEVGKTKKNELRGKEKNRTDTTSPVSHFFLSFVLLLFWFLFSVDFLLFLPLFSFLSSPFLIVCFLFLLLLLFLWIYSVCLFVLPEESLSTELLISAIDSISISKIFLKLMNLQYQFRQMWIEQWPISQWGDWCRLRATHGN